MALHRMKPTEANPYIVCIVYYRDGCFGGERSFKHQCIDRHWVLHRPMVPSEIEHSSKFWREMWYKWKTWEHCILDEWLVTRDYLWVTKIFKLSGLPGWVSDYIEMDKLVFNPDPFRITI